jgi:hypothetical protein
VFQPCAPGCECPLCFPLTQASAVVGHGRAAAKSWHPSLALSLCAPKELLVDTTVVLWPGTSPSIARQVAWGPVRGRFGVHSWSSGPGTSPPGRLRHVFGSLRDKPHPTEPPQDPGGLYGGTEPIRCVFAVALTVGWFWLASNAPPR